MIGYKSEFQGDQGAWCDGKCIHLVRRHDKCRFSVVHVTKVYTLLETSSYLWENLRKNSRFLESLGIMVDGQILAGKSRPCYILIIPNIKKHCIITIPLFSS